MSTLASWLSDHLGLATDYDGVYGAQCMDLVNSYLTQVHGAPAFAGNAVDIPRQYRKGFRWQPNTAYNFPLPGDVVVWRANQPQAGTGPFGHTAVVLVADPYHLVTVDQNWGSIPQARVIPHTYAGVWGWQGLDS